MHVPIRVLHLMLPFSSRDADSYSIWKEAKVFVKYYVISKQLTMEIISLLTTRCNCSGTTKATFRFLYLDCNLLYLNVYLSQSVCVCARQSDGVQVWIVKGQSENRKKWQLNLFTWTLLEFSLLLPVLFDDGIFLITNGRNQQVLNDYLLCKWETHSTMK